MPLYILNTILLFLELCHQKLLLAVAENDTDKSESKTVTLRAIKPKQRAEK